MCVYVGVHARGLPQALGFFGGDLHECPEACKCCGFHAMDSGERYVHMRRTLNLFSSSSVSA